MRIEHHRPSRIAAAAAKQTGPRWRGGEEHAAGSVRRPVSGRVEPDMAKMPHMFRERETITSISEGEAGCEGRGRKTRGEGAADTDTYARAERV